MTGRVEQTDRKAIAEEINPCPKRCAMTPAIAFGCWRCPAAHSAPYFVPKIVMGALFNLRSALFEHDKYRSGFGQMNNGVRWSGHVAPCRLTQAQSEFRADCSLSSRTCRLVQSAMQDRRSFQQGPRVAHRACFSRPRQFVSQGAHPAVVISNAYRTLDKVWICADRPAASRIFFVWLSYLRPYGDVLYPS